MHSWLWDGERFAECDTVPVSDRGFRYGLGLFETLRVREGRVEMWDQHLRRLCTDCAEAGFAQPACDWPAAKVLAASVGIGVARIFVTAGEGGVHDRWNGPGRLMLSVEPRTLPGKLAYRLGLSPRPVYLSGWKTLNYWQNLAALADAGHRGWDEALLCNHAGHLVSGCMANLFWLTGSQWFTPRLGTGARAGVVREWVKSRRNVCEVEAPAAALDNADAVLLTNSWIGVVPVVAIEGRTLPGSVAAAGELGFDGR